MKHFSKLDKLIIAIDKGLHTIAAKHIASRDNPAGDTPDAEFTPEQKKHIAGLMRINHAGEISAQALYLGQAITARDPAVRDEMQIAAIEEIDHLAWCEDRLSELNSRASYLAPVWFLGSFLIGTTAGAIGDAWNLGFVAETEKQVVKHLESHMDSVPEYDLRTQKILTQMRDDEARHEQMAIQSGARTLPATIQKLMGLMSKVMTKTAYKL